MQAPAAKPDTRDQGQQPALPWSAVVVALVAGIGGLALLSWVGTHLVL
jgi:hypothetical protein